MAAAALAPAFIRATGRHVLRVEQAPPHTFFPRMRPVCGAGPQPRPEAPEQAHVGFHPEAWSSALCRFKGCSLNPPFWNSFVRVGALVLALPEDWTVPCSPCSADCPVHLI